MCEIYCKCVLGTNACPSDYVPRIWIYIYYILLLNNIIIHIMNKLKNTNMHTLLYIFVIK